MEDINCILADTEELLTECYRLRYQIYCIETKFEDYRNYPDGLEYDRYDASSIHSLLRVNGIFVGHVRLVFQTDKLRSFPVQEVCKHRLLERSGTVEGSRICVSSERVKQAGINHSGLLVALVKAMIKISQQNAVTGWCGFMEPRFLRRLEVLGIYFEPLGALVEHHNSLRQPAYNPLGVILERAFKERPDIWL